MDETSARLALPYLATGQAQKETTHNEALARIDVIVQACVETAPGNTPPAAPAEGQAWIVGAAPVGAWAGQAHAIAGWTAQGWRFVAPREGMAAWRADAGRTMRYVAGSWTDGILHGSGVTIDGLPVVGARRPAIAAPTGGTTSDAEARAAITAILDAMRQHGLIAV